MAWAVKFFQTARGDYPVQDFIQEQGIATQSKIAIRIFYTVVRGEYYLLHAFKKKSRKTPARELKVALDRIKEIV